MRTTSIVVVSSVLMSCGTPDSPLPPDALITTATQAVATSASDHTFATGSLVIPMDITHQDLSLFKAYGLVYRLLQNNIPVSWVIKPNKSLCTAATSANCIALGAAASDFTVTTKDFVTNAAISPTHAYRGGPFVVDQVDAAAAAPLITALNAPLAAAQKVKVHVTTAPFTGFVKRQLVVAPSIAMFNDGNQGIAIAYLNAAGIPDSQGNAWPAASPDLLTELQVAGPSCTGASECKNTPHNDGKLFDSNGNPAYCQMMSMHYGINDADDNDGREVVREYRSFLKFPVHLFAECQAVNAIENNTNAPFTIAASPNGASEVGTTATFTTTANHDFTIGEPVLVGGVAVVGYNGTRSVTGIPAPNKFTVTLPVSGLAASGGGTARNFNGLFLTTIGYDALDKIRPATVTSLNGDQPFAQFDGLFNTTGGSEPSYLLPTGGAYKAQDVVMLTETGTPVGVHDVWMTGFLDGQCSTLNEFCDPQFAQGKVSYLGGHNYGVSTPLSSGDSQGARLFLNALLEAPCATDLGAASLNLVKTGPLTTNGPDITDVITVFNTGTSIAGNVVVTDTLVAGVQFVPGASERTISTISRATNVVTVNTTTNHGFAVGNRVTVTGVTNAAFDGTFVVTSVANPTRFTYAQTGANAASSGGRVALASDGICVGTAAQCGGSGGGVVTFNLGSVAGNQSSALLLNLHFTCSPAKYNNTAIASFKSGNSTLTVTSNTITTCFYAGNPAICTGGGDPNAPACANGTDDDADGLIDFPDDLGCDSAVDNNEADIASTSNKARVLIAFDTSGSMMWNTCNDTFTGGDGSQTCPGNDVSPATCSATSSGNGAPDDSRLFKVKAGISNVVNGFGEVEWGLMRFRQLPVPFSCGTLNVNKNDGGWQGAGASPCTGFNAGELLVRFDPENVNSMLKWMDGSTNYPTTPPPTADFELRGTGNTPLGGILQTARSLIADARAADDPLVAGCRPYRVILVTDGAETCAGNPVARAGELFAGTDGDGVVPVHVIGFATPDPTVTTQLNQIAVAGGTGAFIAADDEVELSAAIQDIVEGTILTEKCNDLDDDCDGKIDEDFPDKGLACDNGAKGVCTRAGVRVCTTNGSGTTCNAVAVACTNNRLIDGAGNDLGPCTELCNNLDDDCDGKVDEGLTNCTCLAQAEQCNGLDEDCDGRIDESSTNGPPLTRPCGQGTCPGIETCDFAQFGGFGGCTAATPQTEVCDGLDNNCDGLRDGFQQACSTMDPLPPENFPIDDPRNNPGDASNSPNAKNICRPGAKICPANVGPPNQFSACGGEVKPCNVPTNNEPPAPNPAHPNPSCFDACNGLDDDCDDNVDEDFQPQDCSDNCNAGVTTCLNGVLGCTLSPINGDASCNGIDDDCDGTIDEDFVCDDPPNCDCSDAFTCNGVQKCVAGVKVCEGTPISSEICDCSDNNCNAQVDEGNLCGAGSICNEFCQCAARCNNTEFPCPFGQLCKQETEACQDPTAFPGCDASDACTQDPTRTNCCCRSLCIADPCANVSCPPSNGDKQTCQVVFDQSTPGGRAECVSACSVITCAPLACVPATGECKPDDCTTFPERCGDGENCVNGVCVENPCLDVTCGGGQYCVLGDCIDSCAGVQCPAGERCRLGVCEVNPCGGPCPAGQACNDSTGTCVVDRCDQLSCPLNQWCNPTNNGGTCEDDPCQGTACPSPEQVCVGGTCFNPDDLLPPNGGKVEVTAGGGGGCSTTGDSGWFVALGWLVMWRRRRRGVTQQTGRGAR